MSTKAAIKLRLVLCLTIIGLFVGTTFSGVVIGLSKSVSTPGENVGDPITIPWKDNDWDYWTNPPHMFAIPSGNVGIGLLNPSAKLDVYDGYNDVSVNVKGQDDGKSFYTLCDGAAYFMYDEAEAEVRLWNAVTGGNAGFISLGTSGLPRMTLTRDGDVGIGVTNPNTKLEVAGIIRSTSGGFEFPDGTTQTSAVDGHSLDASDGSPSDVVYVNNLGNVGIGLTDPVAKFQVQDGAILFNGNTGATPFSGAGKRLMWIPDKAAFRAGYVNGNQWDDGNIGDYSVAMGYNTTARGENSVAFGGNTIAFYPYAVAMGRNTNAFDYYAFAMGDGSVASGGASTAMGSQTTASGECSTAMGYSTTADGACSTAFGGDTVANGNWATSMGRKIIVDGNYSFGIGMTDLPYTISEDKVLSVMGGKVGINTVNPSEELEIVGDVKVSGIGNGFIFPDGSKQTTAAQEISEVYFSVKLDDSYTWPDTGTHRKIDFSSNSTLWSNEGDAFDMSTSTFTAPVSGTYTFHGAIHFSGINDNSLIYATIYAGGKYYIGEYRRSDGPEDTVTASLTTHLNVGEDAKLFGYIASDPPGQVYGNDSESYAFTHFTGSLVN
ncbi:MAG: hypothetical protein V1726_01210 [Methanobacteriota archaeon]